MKKLFDEETYDKRLRPYYRGNNTIDPGRFDRRGGTGGPNLTQKTLQKLFWANCFSPQLTLLNNQRTPSYPFPPSLWLPEREQLFHS